MRILKLASIITFLCASSLASAQETDDSPVQARPVDISTGNYQEAIVGWTDLIRKIRGGASLNEVSLNTESGGAVGLSLSKLLLKRGEAFLRVGFYNAAYRDLSEATELADTLDLPVLQSMVSGSMGQLQLATQHNISFTGKRIAPVVLFQESLEHALDTDKNELVSVAAVRLGRWYIETGENQLAFSTLEDAVLKADATKSLLLQADARIEYARAARNLQFEDDAIEILRNALARVDQMAEGYSRAELALGVGLQAASFGGATANNIGVPAFNSVVAMSGSLADKRLVGSALVGLGEWYAESGNENKAVEMLERAIGIAPDAHDLAIDWEYKLAQVYRGRGDLARATQAYRRAARHIDRIRHDIPVSYEDGRSSFQETRAPIYYELADLLMQQSDATGDAREKQTLLFEAQAVMETLKGSELRDYFRDTCTIDQSSAIGDDLSDGAMVVYPVILENRVALLVNIDRTFHHVSTPVTADELRQEVTRFAELLRDPGSDLAEVKAVGKRIYDWIISPILPQLQQGSDDTLFFVPDGVLRTIPIAALWSGESYLMESFHIATAPGLTLLNADPITKSKRRTLIAGLSTPGNAITELPDDYYESVFAATLPDGATLPTRGAASEIRNAANDERVRIWHRLNAVETEVTLPERYELPSTVLFDDEFAAEEFNNQLQNNPYEIVHIASHGFFGGEVEDSWIMTHDELLDLGELSSLFKPKEFSDNPVELLILSACETAAGNDLAPLGLSGVALTSGARSVLGSLWLVSDAATQTLMDNFYLGLSENEATKASALRSAQTRVLNTEGLEHPFFWSAFIMVGNWK